MERNTVIGKFKNWKRGKPGNDLISEIRNPKSGGEQGFSLFELMIAMFIIIILISVALPTYQRTVQHAREMVLKENLWQMRRAIDQYATDKGKLPQSLDNLVEGKYLREIPVDPILEKPEWQSVQGDDPNSPDGAQGIKDVKSMADGESSEGKPYSEL
ncbi:MAG: prepilin-type N-terminal cleavage/methylation domain-containing protein [Pyrinomonadaceae bacterium]|nr:prepilin-type N-terminal cleavage/methylation domain-containing protein [Pyrinomonadaceae bacterium]